MPHAPPPSQDLGASSRLLEHTDVSLVLRAARTSDPSNFLFRRAVRAVRAQPSEPSRRPLGLVLDAFASDEEDASATCTRRVAALVGLAGHLESRGLLDGAVEALDFADHLRPNDPELLLHRARVARKVGDVTRARVLYDRVARLDVRDGCLASMAAIGCALLAPDVERALGQAIRANVVRGRMEAAAVAQEARARARRSRGDVEGALRDYAVSALRFGHAADRGRIGHEMADLLMVVGDVMAARRVLLEVERAALPEQRAWARARLLQLAQVLGDELGCRRWSDAGPPALVSLAPRLCRPRSASDRERRLERLLDWGAEA